MSAVRRARSAQLLRRKVRVLERERDILKKPRPGSPRRPARPRSGVRVRRAGRADFSYLKRSLSLTDGNLGRHLSVLENAGLIEIRKGYEGRRARTWAVITRSGRRALRRELHAMRALLRRFDASD
jgi:DNA-binding transcriptional ArsR family regulator